jgi:predicted N-acetyltransferase YhbS
MARASAVAQHARMTTSSTTSLTIREAIPDDGETAGRIFWEAFGAIASRHAFPVEPSSPEFTAYKAAAMLADPGFHGFVAEREGRVVGSAFVDERSPIAGVGPVTVDPREQDGGVGRLLTEAVLRRERRRGAPGVRLVQTAYHYRSLALYAKLGFVVREPLSVVQGEPPRIEDPSRRVRPAAPEDLPAASAVAHAVHGHERDRELLGAIDDRTAAVVEREGRIAGYATGFGYGWHAVARANDDLIALLGSAEAFMGLGVLVPSRNGELLARLLESGLRIVQQSSLMTIGLYNEPAGAWLPSILF